MGLTEAIPVSYNDTGQVVSTASVTNLNEPPRALAPRAGSGVVRMDPLRFLAGCRTRRLNQA